VGADVMGVSALRDLSEDDLEEASGLLDEETFRRVRHVVTENARVQDAVVLLRTEGPHAIAPLLDASHLSMRDDFEISCPELDLAVEASRAAGALGSRMTGGGFGGSAIALTRVEDIDRVSSAVTAAFADADFTEPAIFAVSPADGAGRVS
jgi:galactokinase